MILTPLQKLPNNEGDLGKIIVATSFECLAKKQDIAQSGHTGDSIQEWLQVTVIYFNGLSCSMTRYPIWIFKSYW